MFLTIPFMNSGYWFKQGETVYLVLGVIFVVLYCLGWIVFWKEDSIRKSLYLSIIPSLLFIESGIISGNILLLIAAGFDPSAKSFFSWLGVTYYISAETIDTMLSALSSLCADGSSLLQLDPLYLSVLCGFFGGGDMNGIALLCPEWAAR